jgi:hypothetical protein
MARKIIDEYIQEYFVGTKPMSIKILNMDTGEERFCDLETGTGILKPNEIALFPIGIADRELVALYQGDVVIIEIETKYGVIYRCGVIRTDNLIACGVDYFDDDGFIVEEGDFIEDFYMKDLKRIGTIFQMNLLQDFDWREYVED